MCPGKRMHDAVRDVRCIWRFGMKFVEDIALDLAKKAIAVSRELDDDTVVDKIAEALGASSQLAEEAFMTSVRVLRAETRARKLLKDMALRAANAKSEP